VAPQTIYTPPKPVNSMDLKKQVEAILFSAGRKIEIEEIAKLVEANEASVKKVLQQLKTDFEKGEAPIMIVEEGNAWKMTVREEYLGTVRKITPYMEFSKTLMETLAVVAWKQPILQSDVIKIRTNKAYEHITELENMGFLAKEKHGRSFLLKLSQKFYDYFDLRDDVDVRKLFKNVKDDSPEQKKVSEYGGQEALRETDNSVPESKSDPTNGQEAAQDAASEEIESEGSNDTALEESSTAEDSKPDENQDELSHESPEKQQ